MENFRKYYKFPLHIDDMGVYVKTIDEEMALMFTGCFRYEVIQAIIDKLNGEYNKSIEWSIEYPVWHIKNGTEIWYSDTKVMLIRGWGMLHATGNGGYGLPEEEAIKIQDEFAKYVVDTLNS